MVRQLNTFEMTNMKKALYFIAIISLITSCKKESIKKSHYIGEIYGGGIIFDLSTDKDGNQHGLISSLADVSPSTTWSVVGANGGAETKAVSTWNGKLNTQMIISVLGTWGTAAKHCVDYSAGNNTDWYFPSITETATLYSKQGIINNILENDNDMTTTVLSSEIYWTSVEVDGGGAAYVLDFKTGLVTKENKQGYSHRLRAIRQF